MARIPLQQAQRPLETGNVIQYPSGSPIGAALQDAGGALSNIAMRHQEAQDKIDEFQARQELVRLNDRVGMEFDASRSQMPQAGSGFTEGFVGQLDPATGQALSPGKIDELFTDTLSRIPEHLRPRMQTQMETLRQSWARDAAAAQIDARRAFYEAGITEDIRRAEVLVQQGGEGALDTALESVRTSIGMADLTADEKQALELQAQVSLAKQAALGLPKADAETRLGLTAPTVTGAADLLREFEGFRETPYWDVNAYRVGYGTDTVTHADGTVEKVTTNTVVTREGAERDLRRRISEFRSTAVSAVGKAAWDALPANAQAALISVTYNYGRLPANVAAAVQRGDIEGVASAVEKLSANKDRRRQEAAFIRSGTIAVSEDQADPRYALLSADERTALLADVETRENQALADATKERQAQYATNLNDLETGIFDRTQGLTDIEEARRSWLTDIEDIKRLTNLYEDRNKEILDLQAAQSAIADPAKVWDPTDADDKDSVDLLFEADGGQQRIVQRDQGYIDTVVAPLVQRTAMIPREAKGAFLSMLRSQDGTALTWVLGAMDQIERVNPEAFTRDMGENAVRQLMMWRESKDFRTPEQIVEMLREESDPATRQARQKLEEEGLKQAATVTDAAILDHFDPGAFAAGPDAPIDPVANQRLRVEFDTLFAQEFARTGDSTLAQQNALKLLETTWGASSVSGTSRLMRFPPERYHGRVVGIGHDWMAEQVTADLGPLLIAPDGSARTFELVADEDTEAMISRGESPSYAVVIRDENGIFNAQFDEQGRIARQSFDIGPAREAARTQYQIDTLAGEEAELLVERDTSPGPFGMPAPNMFEGPTPERRAEIDRRLQEIHDEREDIAPLAAEAAGIQGRVEDIVGGGMADMPAARAAPSAPADRGLRRAPSPSVPVFQPRGNRGGSSPAQTSGRQGTGGRVTAPPAPPRKDTSSLQLEGRPLAGYLMERITKPVAQMREAEVRNTITILRQELAGSDQWQRVWNAGDRRKIREAINARIRELEASLKNVTS